MGPFFMVKKREAIRRRDMKLFRKTLSITGKVLGVGLIVADIAATAVGAILCAVSSQD